ncbi:hypothetical protein SVTN_00505 [Streptomyces vietnamensis]|uniref:Uncharacterized protein n=1 Tax=Streptomyces vietnamensis TaxID=362257 RepID=A0A0B5HY42_9ACTN|nr:hypothetical protein SVTN_00505 [Streptomyces vietnamensis]
MLDGCVARRQKKKRPPFGLPKRIVLLATPEGWRHSILTVDGGMVCGRLSNELLDPEVALDAAATLLKECARDFHDNLVEVTWDPRQEPWTWTGEVIPVSGDEAVSADSGG